MFYDINDLILAAYTSNASRVFAIVGLYSLNNISAIHFGVLGAWTLNILYYVFFSIVAYTIMEKVLETKDDRSAIDDEVEILHKPRDIDSYLHSTHGTHKEVKKRDIPLLVTSAWGLDNTVSTQIENIINLVVGDFITPWFDSSK